ncbi:MAG: cation transporter [Flavobacteriales bacterium]
MKRLLSHAKRAALLSLITNFILAIVKGLGGLIGHSDALIADAIESCADIFSSFLVLFGLQYPHKPADEDRH